MASKSGISNDFLKPKMSGGFSGIRTTSLIPSQNLLFLGMGKRERYAQNHKTGSGSGVET